MPAVLSTVYCTEDDIRHLLSAEGEIQRLDDDNDNFVSTYDQQALTNAINYATSRVNFYCQPLYDVADMATSWLVNEWATIIASRWVSSRRAMQPPMSIEAMYKEAIEDMTKVRAFQMQIPDIGTRNVTWPAWSNVNVNFGYRYARMRVEQPISERTPTQYGQHVDWSSLMIFEW